MRPTREELEAMIYAALIGAGNTTSQEGYASPEFLAKKAIYKAKVLLDLWAERDAQEADHE